MEGSRLHSLGGVSWTGKVGDERPLRGGEPVASREGATVAGTPLGFFVLRGMLGGK
jgi:hypothetical protein